MDEKMQELLDFDVNFEMDDIDRIADLLKTQFNVAKEKALEHQGDARQGFDRSGDDVSKFYTATKDMVDIALKYKSLPESDRNGRR